MRALGVARMVRPLNFTGTTFGVRVSVAGRCRHALWGVCVFLQEGRPVCSVGSVMLVEWRNRARELADEPVVLRLVSLE